MVGKAVASPSSAPSPGYAPRSATGRPLTPAVGPGISSLTEQGPGLAPEPSPTVQAHSPRRVRLPHRDRRTMRRHPTMSLRAAGRRCPFVRAPAGTRCTGIGPLGDPGATPSHGTSSSASASTARRSCSGERSTKVAGQSEKPALVVEVRRSGRPASSSRSDWISASTLRSAAPRGRGIGSPRIEAKTTCPGCSHGSNGGHLRCHPYAHPVGISQRAERHFDGGHRHLGARRCHPVLNARPLVSPPEHHPPWWR